MMDKERTGKFHQNKKAASVLMMVFEVLAVLLVVYMVMSISKAYGESDTVVKINTAEDLRMMVNTLVAVPGEALVEYPHDVSKFSFILSRGGISVFTKGELENRWVVRKFYLPEGYLAEGVLETPEYLCLEKKAKKILLRKCP